MTNKEARAELTILLRRLENDKLGTSDYPFSCRHTIEAVDIAIKALEKQIPKKPNMTTIAIACENEARNEFSCPECYNSVGAKTPRGLTVTSKYCDYCGQAIDWSD